MQTLIELAKLEMLLFETEEAQNTKLDLIKEEIKNEAYQINPKNIAAKLLEYRPTKKEKIISNGHKKTLMV